MGTTSIVACGQTATGIKGGNPPVLVDSTGVVQVAVVSGGTGGGAVTIADGADTTEGTKADSPATSGTGGSWTIAALLRGILNAVQAAMATYGFATTVTTGVTRPGDTNIYTANDAWANSTSAPTAGGFTLTAVSRASGGSGIITDAVIVSSNDPATLLQGEIWLYDSAVATADNDNAAFTSSDADTLLLVGVIPFTLASTAAGSGTTSAAHVSGLNYGFTCVGTANLRYKIKVKNAYTPANAEVLTVRLKIVQTN